MYRGRAMSGYGDAFIGLDTSKAKNALAIAEDGRGGEVRYLGEFENTAQATRKLVRRLAEKHDRLHFCYEAGPTGAGSTASFRIWNRTVQWWHPR
jgi:transposase